MCQAFFTSAMIDANLVASEASHNSNTTNTYYYLTALGVTEAARLDTEGQTLYLPQASHSTAHCTVHPTVHPTV